MTSKTPVVALIAEPDGPWRVEVRDFGRFCDAVGADVLREFARCFVHADRLTSLVSFMYYNMEKNKEGSTAFRRDLQTAVWLVVGTLRELADAIRGLRSALRKRELLDAESQAWKRLRALELRWADDPFFRKMRDQVAFHVDAPVVEKGLEELVKAGQPVVIAEGDGDKQRHGSLRLGLETLFMGGEKDTAEFDTFLQTVVADHEAASIISEVFIAVLRQVDMEPEHVTA